MSRFLPFFSLILLLALGSFPDVDAATVGTKIKGPKDTDHGALGHRYGPIRSSDTLWRIAKKITPDDPRITIYQVMYALYQKNPRSFEDDNYNYLINDTYLKIPTLREMRAINREDARKKAELDDELWSAKLRGDLTPKKIEYAKEQITNVKQADLQQAKNELSNNISSMQAEQSKQFDGLKQELLKSASEMAVEREVNQAQQKRLDTIGKSLEALREQSKKDNMDLMAVIQAMREEERVREMARLEAENKNSFAALWQKVTENIIAVGIGSTLLTFILVIYFVMRAKRKKQQAEDQAEEMTLFETPKPQPSPPPQQPAQDSLMPEDITNDSFSLDDVDESLTTLDDDLLMDDDIVQLDKSDALPDDNLYDKDEPGLEDDDSLDGMLAQSDLDDLLGDEDFDLLSGDDDDSLGEFGGEDDMELTATNVDELLSMDDDTAVADEDDLDSLVDNNQPITDDEDIDSLLDQFQDDKGSNDDLDEIELDIPEEQEPQTDEHEQGNLAPDDVDALMDELATPQTVMDEDDIDALLNEVGGEAPKVETESRIDNSTEDEAVVEDDFDIDALIDESVNVEGDKLEADDEEQALDLDSIIGSVSEQADQEDDQPSSIDDDIDIDALLDEASLKEELLPDNESIEMDDLLEAALQNQATAESELADDELEGEYQEKSVANKVPSTDDALQDLFDEGDVVSTDEDATAEGVEQLSSVGEEADADDLDDLLSADDEAEADDLDELLNVDEEIETDDLDDLPSVDKEAEADDLDKLLNTDKENEADDLDDLPSVDKEAEADDLDELLNTDEEIETDDLDDLLNAGKETEADDLDELLNADEEIEADDLDDLLNAGKETEADDLDELLNVDEEIETDDLDELLNVDEEIEADDLDELLNTDEEIEADDLDDLPSVDEKAEADDLDELLNADDNLNELLNIDDEIISDIESAFDSVDDDELNDLALDGEQIDISEDDEAVESPSIKLDEYPELSIDDLDNEAPSSTADFELDDVEDASLDDETQELPDLEDPNSDGEALELDAQEDVSLDDEVLDLDDLSDINIEGDELDLDAMLSTELDVNEQSPSEVDASFTAQEGLSLEALENADFDDILSEIEAESPATEIDNFDELDDVNVHDLDIQDNDDIAIDLDDMPREFVTVESLLQQSADELEDDLEQYDGSKIDIDLDDFDEMTGKDKNPKFDVDTEDGGFAAQLDLANVYVEMGDAEEATAILQKILANGPDSVKEEATALLKKLNESA